MSALRHPGRTDDRGGGRLWLLAFCLAVLATRLLIPAGYMPLTDGRIAITLCPDSGEVRPVMTDTGHHYAAAAHPGQHDDSAQHDAPVCAYAVLAAPVLGWFVISVATSLPLPVAIELLAIPPPPLLRQYLHLRPPLRGPPMPASIRP